MNPKRKQRLFIILGLVSGLGVAVGLVMYALSQNINLFFHTNADSKRGCTRDPDDSRGRDGCGRDCRPGSTEPEGCV